MICRGVVDDAEELAAFAAHAFEEAFAAENDWNDLKAHLDTSFGLKQQAAELADPDVETILVRLDGVLSAYAQVRRSPPPPCVTQASPIELHRFYVDSKAHGTGLASSLIQEVHTAAHEFEGRHVWLGVWERNARAIAFYRKMKFVDVGSKFYMVGPDRQLDRVLVTSVCP